MKLIESTQNKTIRELTKLHKKKERDKTNLFLVEGQHLVHEAYEAGCLKEVFILQDEKLSLNVPLTYCTKPVLQKLSVQNSQAKIIGLCKKMEWTSHPIHKALFLDDVQDPGNVGTIIRTALAFGIEAVYCSSGCADIYNPKTIQSSQGALFHVPVIYTDLIFTILNFKNNGMNIYATSLHSQSVPLDRVQVPESYGIVLGNEGQGVHPELIELCHQTIKIEMASFESLNVAIAGGILSYYFFIRQGDIKCNR